MNINSIVRRLCPLETERLMHFPDNYLHIDGDATPDSPMFKGCGNSWGVNNARWVNLRLEHVLRDTGLVANDRVVQYATTCSGVEAHTLSVKGQNWHANFYSEIEPFPCRVLAHHYPDTPNLGDMTKLDGHPYSLDVFSGGTPCFTAGNMVLTESGYRPIETIREGDMVMTHEGRLRKVVAIGAKMAYNIVDVTIATRQKIRCTADHKFWAAVRPHRDFRRHADTFLKVQFDGMSFQPISKVGVGGYVAQLSEYETMPLPKMPKVYNASDADILELAGWYVGDGHCAGFSNTRHKKVLVLSLSESKVENFRSRFNGVVNFTAYPHDKNGVYRVQVACAELCDWLVENFGHLSHNKNIPAWLIASTDENRQSFLEGYMATDGYSSQQARLSFGCSSTSYALALGIADLVGKCAVYKANVPPTKEMYDGRIVNQRPFWTVRRSTKPNRFHDYGKWSGVRVREIRERCPEVVYNITVEDDHSYIVNGLCVSNCQSVSVAGKRHGMAKGSGTRSSLAYHWIRIGNEAVKPGGVLLWENVCFSPDTLVTLDTGHKKIRDIQVGDMVRSIDGNYHRVERVMETPDKQTIKIKAMGADVITATPNHPFYARLNLHSAKDPSKRSFTKPEWLPAGQLSLDHYIGFKVDPEGSKSIGMAKAYAVGRWLADGSVALLDPTKYTGAKGGQRTRIFISTGWKKHDALLKELSRLPYKISESKVKDYAINFTFNSDEFYELVKDCGRGALKKKVPPYAFTLIPEEQKELLRGYFDGDGHLHKKSEMTYGTSSHELALGIARLIRNVYHRGVSIKLRKGNGKTVIDGRTVNARDHWDCSFAYSKIPEDGKKHLISFYEDGFVWCPIREIAQGEAMTVYNLTVADTHTYEANDIVVHNCGALSVNEGKDFAAFVSSLTEEGYAVAWRTMDMQWLSVDTAPRAVPQRRRRIWLIAQKGSDWRIPARVLFERASRLGTVHPNRIVDGRIIRSEEEEAAAAFDLFGGNEPTFNHDSRADMIPFSEMPGKGDDFLTLSYLSLVDFFRKVGTIQYVGGIFDGAPEVANISARLRENIGNAGCAVGGRIVTLKIPEWSAGIQLPFGAECPAEYDGTVCGLSDVLLPMTDDLLGYILSPRACTGILRRADKRGKKLPEPLELALHEQIANWACGAFGDAVKADEKDEAEEAEGGDEDVETDEDGNPIGDAALCHSTSEE